MEAIRVDVGSLFANYLAGGRRFEPLRCDELLSHIRRVLLDRQIYRGPSVAGWERLLLYLVDSPGYRIEPLGGRDGRASYRIPAEFVASSVLLFLSFFLLLVARSQVYVVSVPNIPAISPT
jgi:hypothetical protein